MLKSLLMVGVSAVAVSAATADATVTFDFSGSLVEWTAATTGEYVIDVYGAEGGNYLDALRPGLGIGISGEFKLLAGETLEIAVGGEGGEGSTGGGGGGSFVASAAGVPVIVAGGGAGISYNGEALPNTHANASAAEGNGQGGSVYGDGGGGGGFYSAGEDYHGYTGYFHFPSNAYGGGDFPGLEGGDGYYSGFGGFGGGGGGGYNDGGGGGGFGGGKSGDGGYSFNSGANQSTLGYRTGNGLVSISAVPEPSTWSLMLTSLGFLGYVLRRRMLRLTRW